MEKTDKYVKLMLVLSVAYVAVTFLLETRIASLLKNQVPLLWITAALTLVNIGWVLFCLFRREKMGIILPLLILAQLGVFWRFHIQLHDILGGAHFSYEQVPQWQDWGKFVAAHVIQAIDLPDAVGSYGIRLQQITPQSAMANGVLFAMYLLISLFILITMFKLVHRRSQIKSPSPIMLWARRGALALSAAGILFLGWKSDGGIVNALVGLFTHILFALDIGDAFQVFALRPQIPEKGMALASMATIFRGLVLVYAVLLLHGLYLRILEGRKSPEDYAKIIVSPKHASDERVAAIRKLQKRSRKAIGDSVILPLVSVLGDSYSDVRAVAANALMEIDDEWPQSDAAGEAIPNLVKSLLNEEEEAYLAATNALEKIDPKWHQSEATRGAIPHLVGALKHADQGVRAAQALGTIGPAAVKTVPNLVTALSHENADIRGASANALGIIGPIAKEATPQLVRTLTDPEQTVQDAATESLGKIGTVAIPLLVEALSDSDEDIRNAATGILDKIDPKWRKSESASEAIRRLSRMMADSFSSDRATAVEAIGIISPSAAISQLAIALVDGEESVRKSAKEALEKMDPEWQKNPGVRKAVPIFLKALTNADTKVRERAKALLEKVYPKWRESEMAGKTLPYFVRALGDTLNTVRCAAAEALGEMGAVSAQAIPHLVKLSADNDSDVRRATKAALEKIDPKWQKSKTTAKAIPRLVKDLSDDDWRIRNSAASALGNMGSAAARAIPYIVKLLNDSDKRVRTTSIESLEKIFPKWRQSKGVKKVIPHFIKALGSPQWIVRVSAADALGEIGPPAGDAAPHLANALKDSVVDVQSAAKKSLKKIDPTGKLRNRELGAENRYVKDASLEILGDIDPGSPKAVSLLVKKLTDSDRGERNAARKVLKKIDPKWQRNKAAHSAIPHIMESLSDGRWAVRGAAIEALGDFGPIVGKIAVPRLMKAMITDSSVDVQDAARKALEKIDPAGKLRKQ
ncbi:MAG: hypothetical protein B6245_05600 [Desulfobacteraceae bacterium 4572_88]|nr:MAG: hypothetical protein B6245_05600 [Desulfobacteraceae bacterium 4572_88]